MNNREFEERLTRAVEASEMPRSAPVPGAAGFEHHVWSEIAVRDGASRGNRWLSLFQYAWTTPGIALCALFAVATGAWLGVKQADDYVRQADRSMEEAYVSSIHSVLMSESDLHDHPQSSIPVRQ